MKCLVMGGGGFLGRNLTNLLLNSGYQVRVFDYSVCAVAEGVEVFQGDFLEIADIENAMQGIDTVFHLISTTVPESSNDNPIFDLQSNLVGSLNILNMAVKCGVCKLVFSSSGGTVYGASDVIPITEDQSTNPTCSYGIVKLAIEKYLQLFYDLYGLDYAVVRISNPYGEGQKSDMQGVVGVFSSRAVSGTLIDIWGDGSVIRDYLHVDDVSEAMLRVMAYQGKERLFNVGSGEGRSLNQILDTLEDILGYSVNKRYQKARSFDVPVSVLDISRSERLLGWQPKISFDSGLRKTVQSLLKSK